MKLEANVAGSFVEDGEGEASAVFRRSFYLHFPGGGYACVGEPAVGRGPLNALVDNFQLPAPGARVTLSLAGAQRWKAPALPPSATPDVRELQRAARGRVPTEGLGGLVLDAHNALSGHALPALEAIERWLVGNALEDDAEALIGLGPGLTPSGDDYLGGVLIALVQLDRKPQAQALWRWLGPRLERTSAISAAHLTAAAAGEGHEALHRCLEVLCTGGEWTGALDAIASVGHVSGWDSLAGVVAVAKLR